MVLHDARWRRRRPHRSVITGRSGFLPEDFPGKSQQRIVPLDRVRVIGHFSDSLGIEIPLVPFFGSMGVAPATGRINSAPPTTHAGNLDNKELHAGTILYITALETALRGRFQFIVRKDMTSPALTARAWRAPIAAARTARTGRTPRRADSPRK